MPDAAARWLSALRSVSYGPVAAVGTPSCRRDRRRSRKGRPQSRGGQAWSLLTLGMPENNAVLKRSKAGARWSEDEERDKK